jgi:hypothetical protein
MLVSAVLKLVLLLRMHCIVLKNVKVCSNKAGSKSLYLFVEAI